MIDKIKEVLMIHQKINIGAEELENAVITPAYGAREMVEPVPKYELPTHGMPARTA